MIPGGKGGKKLARTGKEGKSLAVDCEGPGSAMITFALGNAVAIGESCCPAVCSLFFLWWLVAQYQLGPWIRFWLPLPYNQIFFVGAWEALLLQLLAGIYALQLTTVVVDTKHPRQPGNLKVKQHQGFCWEERNRVKEGQCCHLPWESCRLNRAEDVNNSLQHQGSV